MQMFEDFDNWYLREQKIKQAATYYIDYKWSIREVADNMCVDEKTVRNWFHKELKHIDDDLYYQVKKRIESNKQVCRDRLRRFECHEC